MADEPDLRYVVLDALEGMGVSHGITLTNVVLNALRQNRDEVLRHLGGVFEQIVEGEDSPPTWALWSFPNKEN